MREDAGFHKKQLRHDSEQAHTVEAMGMILKDPREK